MNYESTNMKGSKCPPWALTQVETATPLTDHWWLNQQSNGPAFCIRVWTVVQAVLTATFNSYSDRQISTPYKINTPEPIDKKFGTVDNVREGTLYTTFDTNPPTKGFLANGWNITKIIFYLYLFFLRHAHRSDPWMDFFTCDSSKDAKSRKDVPFWGLNDVPLNFGGKTPQKLKFGGGAWIGL